jgi:hypothetical protein
LIEMRIGRIVEEPARVELDEPAGLDIGLGGRRGQDEQE